MMYLKATVLPNGNLEITTYPETLAELAIDRVENEDFQSDDYMHDLFESLIANSEYAWIQPEEIGALTDAPIIGIRGPERIVKPGENTRYMYITGGDGVNNWVEDVVQAWYFNDYAITSVQEQLLDEGRVIFYNAFDNA